MDSKKILEKLFSIAAKQQQIIMKMAQVPAASHPTLRPADAILGDLAANSPATRAAIAVLEVQGTNVKVRFKPNMGTDAAFTEVQNSVTRMQQNNQLPPGQYTVNEA